ncbi:MAG: hypothetical protein ACXVCY_07950 [Pseudobdellovibrionaceae bacterium]
MKLGFFTIAAVASLGLTANAQTSSTKLSSSALSTSSSLSSTVVPESSLKLDSVLSNKKFEDDKDITDSKLKADSGSLSRYSLKFSLSYYGPPVGDLSNKKQPNPDGSIGVYDTSLGGAISGRYRLDSKSAISLGTGVSVLTPFHGAERTDVKTPFVSYDRNSRWGNWQGRNSYGVSVTTIPNYRTVGQVGTLSYDNAFVYNFGTSGFAAEWDTSLSYFLYERDYIRKDGKASTYYVSFYPQLKYNISDKLNVYTSYAINFWNPRYATEDVILNKVLSGRLGMGWAITRDVYFAPYLNFFPEKLAADTTTVSFSTIFSIL